MLKLLVRMYFYKFLLKMKSIGRKKENAFSFVFSIFLLLGFSWYRLFTLCFHLNPHQDKIALFSGVFAMTLSCFFIMGHMKYSDRIWHKILDPQNPIKIKELKQKLYIKKIEWETRQLLFRSKIQNVYLIFTKQKKIKNYKPKKKIL